MRWNPDPNLIHLTQLIEHNCQSQKNKLEYLTALPDPVVPLARELIQHVRVVVKQNIQDVLQHIISLFQKANNTSDHPDLVS